jgi:hypothetical protein
MGYPAYIRCILTGPKDLLVGHRTSWGILPQTPVFSLRSARRRDEGPNEATRGVWGVFPLRGRRLIRRNIYIAHLSSRKHHTYSRSEFLFFYTLRIHDTIGATQVVAAPCTNPIASSLEMGSTFDFLFSKSTPKKLSATCNISGLKVVHINCPD